MSKRAPEPMPVCAGHVQLAPTNFSPCGRRGRHEYEGRLYCSQHDPASRQERLAAQDRKRRLERAAPDLLLACRTALGVVDPEQAPATYALLEAAIRRAEGESNQTATGES